MNWLRLKAKRLSLLALFGLMLLFRAPRETLLAFDFGTRFVGIAVGDTVHVGWVITDDFVAAHGHY